MSAPFPSAPIGHDQNMMPRQQMGSGQAVFVEAPARLHFGVLDLRGALGRRFGGIGAAAPAPTLLVSACPADTLEVGGEDADRAADFARRFLAHHGLPAAPGCACTVRFPPHAGLGSGTQLALAVARALAELYGVATDAPGARARGRTRAALRHRHVDVRRRRSRARGRTTPGARRASLRCSPGCPSRPRGGASSPCRTPRLA